jgi:plasmid replication initiation protein
MIEDSLIVKSNKLIESRMKFTANEYLLITYLTSKIKKDDREFRTFKLPANELNEFLEIKGTKTNNYLRNQYAMNLSKKDIISKGNIGNKIYNFFSVIDTDHRGYIEICFSLELKDFLIDLKDNFTTYRLSNVVKLKNFYTIRLYELLKQYEKIGKREFKVEDLKYILGLGKKQYNIFRDFRKRILTESIEKINNHTDLKIKLEEKKYARKTYSLVFYIENNNNLNTSSEIINLKEKIENVLGKEVNLNILENTIKKYNIEKNKIYYYLDNWKAFNYKSKENAVGFLLQCIINDVPIPVRQSGFTKPEQSYNFDQREYDDEYFESLYDNFRT